MSAVVDAGALLTNNQVPRGYAGDTLSSARTSNLPTQQDFINIFGPAGQDVKLDENRFGRINRLHLPDVLKGPNQWMTDRIDGLITDVTNSPYTTLILPYKFLESPDGKLKWNVWTFDKGLASRVPYESAARTMTQRKEEFNAYTIRQGIAMTMEHNFMMSEEGRRNFQNQLKQIVQTIQTTNDLDVNMALINAPNYFKKVREEYYRDPYNVEKEIRDYVDNFGFLQKNSNGLDILIEDAKNIIRGWDGDEPDFILLNSKLTFQITMLPEKTQYITQGIDGLTRLREGPNIPRYRGLNVIRSKAFSIENGSAPRDLLRRRVRVAEYYLIPNCYSVEDGTMGVDSGNANVSNLSRNGVPFNEQGVNMFSDSADNNIDMITEFKRLDDVNGQVQLYDESCDSWTLVGYDKLLEQARKFINRCNSRFNMRMMDDPLKRKLNGSFGSVLLVRPNIEHWMLGIILGKGGIDYLGATLWGQTELSNFDDGQHGIWGMSYKYHEKAIVFNERNMIRIWDVAYDGYVGGKDTTMLDWDSEDDIHRFIQADAYLSKPYNGPSLIVLPMPSMHTLPSPIPIGNIANPMFTNNQILATSDIFVEDVAQLIQNLSKKINANYLETFKLIISLMYEQLNMNRNNSTAKDACSATTDNEVKNCFIDDCFDPYHRPPPSVLHITGLASTRQMQHPGLKLEIHRNGLKSQDRVIMDLIMSGLLLSVQERVIALFHSQWVQESCRWI